MELFTIIAAAMTTFNPQTSHDFWWLGKNNVLMINSVQRDMTAPSSTKWASCNGGMLASILNETSKWKVFIMDKCQDSVSYNCNETKPTSTECGLPNTVKSQKQIIYTQWRRSKKERENEMKVGIFLSFHQHPNNLVWSQFLSKTKSKLHPISFFPAHLEK